MAQLRWGGRHEAHGELWDTIPEVCPGTTGDQLRPLVVALAAAHVQERPHGLVGGKNAVLRARSARFQASFLCGPGQVTQFLWANCFSIYSATWLDNIISSSFPIPVFIIQETQFDPRHIQFHLIKAHVMMGFLFTFWKENKNRYLFRGSSNHMRLPLVWFQHQGAY